MPSPNDEKQKNDWAVVDLTPAKTESLQIEPDARESKTVSLSSGHERGLVATHAKAYRLVKRPDARQWGAKFSGSFSEFWLPLFPDDTFEGKYFLTASDAEALAQELVSHAVRELQPKVASFILMYRSAELVMPDVLRWQDAWTVEEVFVDVRRPSASSTVPRDHATGRAFVATHVQLYQLVPTTPDPERIDRLRFVSSDDARTYLNLVLTHTLFEQWKRQTAASTSASASASSSTSSSSTIPVPATASTSSSVRSVSSWVSASPATTTGSTGPHVVRSAIDRDLEAYRILPLYVVPSLWPTLFGGDAASSSSASSSTTAQGTTTGVRMRPPFELCAPGRAEEWFARMFASS